MKKMMYGNMMCEVSVADNCRFAFETPCAFRSEVIAYAVERFFAHSTALCREYTYESWQLRLAKGKERRPRRFRCVVPAALMELPGSWIRLSGEVGPVGVAVRRIEFLSRYPGAMRETAPARR